MKEQPCNNCNFTDKKDCMLKERLDMWKSQREVIGDEKADERIAFSIKFAFLYYRQEYKDKECSFLPKEKVLDQDSGK